MVRFGNELRQNMDHKLWGKACDYGQNTVLHHKGNALFCTIRCVPKRMDYFRIKIIRQG